MVRDLLASYLLAKKSFGIFASHPQRSRGERGCERFSRPLATSLSPALPLTPLNEATKTSRSSGHTFIFLFSPSATTATTAPTSLSFPPSKKNDEGGAAQYRLDICETLPKGDTELPVLLSNLQAVWSVKEQACRNRTNKVLVLDEAVRIFGADGIDYDITLTSRKLGNDKHKITKESV